MSTGAPHPKTLWEEGHQPGPLVVVCAGLLVLPVVLIDLWAFDRLTPLFDVSFVLVCAAAALAVRPRDFFMVGVLPPLLMATTVLVLTGVARGAVARADDGFGQALVSGLAHHAGPLIAGYGLTLVLLALRQVAVKNAGRLRASRPSEPSPVAERTSAELG